MCCLPPVSAPYSLILFGSDIDGVPSLFCTVPSCYFFLECFPLLSICLYLYLSFIGHIFLQFSNITPLEVFADPKSKLTVIVLFQCFAHLIWHWWFIYVYLHSAECLIVLPLTLYLAEIHSNMKVFSKYFFK